MSHELVISNKINFFIASNGDKNLIALSNLKFFSTFFISQFSLSIKFRVFTFFTIKRLKLEKLDLFFLSWNAFFVRKIKFRHKVTWFKISRKYNQFIRFNLGLCHFNYVIFCLARFTRKKKYLTYHNFLFWSTNILNLNFIMLFIKKMQPINAYTQKGFRFSRDVYIKRGGKMSKYAHLKSKLF